MKKNYFFVIVLLFVALFSNAQLAKHYTAADTTVNSWWVNNSQIAMWELAACLDNPDEIYPLFTADLSLLEADETMSAWSWATDLKVDTSMSENALDILADAQGKMFLNFWANPFDGINAADSLGFSFEILAPDKKGWPGITLEPIPADTWTWVSIDLTELLFSDMLIADADEITMLKFAIQNTVEYAQQDGFFKFGIQDITVSKNAADAPANSPCSARTALNTIGQNKLNFYPNPACNEINFIQETTGEILSLSGKSVLKFTNVTSVDISSLNSGLYLVKSANEVNKLIVE